VEKWERQREMGRGGKEMKGGEESKIAGGGYGRYRGGRGRSRGIGKISWWRTDRDM